MWSQFLFSASLGKGQLKPDPLHPTKNNLNVSLVLETSLRQDRQEKGKKGKGEKIGENIIKRCRQVGPKDPYTGSSFQLSD